ncbi:N-dimethylarginine dimethylaminohydrolase [Saccharopolyspora erythraea NRRL 2338]|uniref:Amidinotransferase n=3 Tax=Saccharopolyspora erythraea TaxID=1836 RepID=A4FEM8_SACEN|nr:arginine deiminase-related protein [Saccharopolyspora erythraea]PFG96228.1 N-dimethylarginine dimethylaminohydrolase [Saccharopolyspora erythraea NRRL 2338]QRK92755.1 amidinotransferase [Saccharopolyspora erythraea]CAM02503.1 amidinotransferase [Saccharopolyspora erythraea NRRL 2338]
MNTRLLVSDAEHFRIDYEINPYMTTDNQPDTALAVAEHKAILEAHLNAGRFLEHVPSEPECPDMVYVANSALVCGGRAVLGSLPAARRPETRHHRRWFERLGLEVIDAPFAFSGQGDALPCGGLLFAGSGWRTDPRMHGFLRRRLGYEVVSLRTVNDHWYDIDLAVAVLDQRTVAYCPQVLDEPSRRRIRGLGLDLIEVPVAEAERFALNLVSDGASVTMACGAPEFAGELRARGFTVFELDITELAKGGGGVRCTSLTLDNP